MAVLRRSSGTLVRAVGELDIATAPILQDALDQARAHGRDVLLDLSRVTFCDAAALGVVVQTHRELLAEGRAVRVVDATPLVAKVLAITGLDALLAA